MSAQLVDRRTFLAGLSGLVLVASASRIVKAADASAAIAAAIEENELDPRDSNRLVAQPM